MLIDLDILFTWGGVAKKYRKNDIIFYEDTCANFYYQIIEGRVKLMNCNDKGKEYIQGMFEAGNCFGEPPLLLGCKYPCTAVCLSDCVILKLSKDKFSSILSEYPHIQQSLLHLLAYRIYNKSLHNKHIINQTPEHRIISFLESYKSQSENHASSVMIPYTRQEIADLTGLRVETVIRTLSLLNKKQRVQIKNHKIYW